MSIRKLVVYEDNMELRPTLETEEVDLPEETLKNTDEIDFDDYDDRSLEYYVTRDGDYFVYIDGNVTPGFLTSLYHSIGDVDFDIEDALIGLDEDLVSDFEIEPAEFQFVEDIYTKSLNWDNVFYFFKFDGFNTLEHVDIQHFEG